MKEIKEISNVFDSIEDYSDIEFLSITEVKSISVKHFNEWKFEYIRRLKRIFKNNISKCANKGEFNYIFLSEIMSAYKIESLIKSIKEEIVPMLKGYSIDFSVLNQSDNIDSARMKICISWM